MREEAREEERTQVRAQKALKEARAQEERRGEREVEAQEGHDGEEEMATQEKCVEANKETNSMHEENDVSNRHMTWWRDAWWVRLDNDPHLRTARGRRRVWRAATGAAREARETERIARREREKWEQGTTGRKESNTLLVVFHFTGVLQLKELVTKVELLFANDDHSVMWTRVALSFSVILVPVFLAV